MSPHELEIIKEQIHIFLNTVKHFYLFSFSRENQAWQDKRNEVIASIDALFNFTVENANQYPDEVLRYKELQAFYANINKFNPEPVHDAFSRLFEAQCAAVLCLKSMVTSRIANLIAELAKKYAYRLPETIPFSAKERNEIGFMFLASVRPSVFESKWEKNLSKNSKGKARKLEETVKKALEIAPTLATVVDSGIIQTGIYAPPRNADNVVTNAVATTKINGAGV